jgi:hypothetical protein
VILTPLIDTLDQPRGKPNSDELLTVVAFRSAASSAVSFRCRLHGLGKLLVDFINQPLP